MVSEFGKRSRSRARRRDEAVTTTELLAYVIWIGRR